MLLSLRALYWQQHASRTGDQPQIELKTVEAIYKAFRYQPASLLTPSYKMRQGSSLAGQMLFVGRNSGSETTTDFLSHIDML